MTNDEARALLTAPDVLALTMYGEARGDNRDGSSVEERIAVGCVVRNRLTKDPARFGHGFASVCWARLQFSCWNENDPNSAELWHQGRIIASGIRITDPILAETHWLARGIVDGVIRDNTDGATHYFAPRSMKPAGTRPNWAIGKTPCATVGTQLFFKGV